MNLRKASMMVLTLALSIPATLQAQYAGPKTQQGHPFEWPKGKVAALSLSFDDGRSSQVLRGVPIFDRHQVKATFFVNPGALSEQLALWKAAAANGHEIANHSVSHPCSGNFPWSRQNALESMTLEDITREMEDANQQILQLLGVTSRTFAYPCGQKFVGRGRDLHSYVPVVADHFLAARGWLDEAPNDPSFCDPAQLMGVELDGLDFEQAKALIDDAVKQGFWLVFAGHDIGQPARQTSLESTIDAICAYATRPDSGIWIDTVGHVADWVVQKRQGQPEAEPPQNRHDSSVSIQGSGFKGRN